MSLADTLPEPVCQYGYTQDQIDGLFGTPETRQAFHSWMYGQTMAICEGEAPCTRAHGLIYYESDVRRFILGLPVLD